jgi:hypothetical protein
MSRTKLPLVAAIFTVVVLQGTRADAASFSFTGNFTNDDDVQLFTFLVGAPSEVTLRSWSYAGGTNAEGDVILRGGFDPILALFDSTGALVAEQDDAGCPLVPADALTGECWDTNLTTGTLAAGTYTASIQQYDNFSAGSLAAGFERQGQGNFTPTISGCDEGTGSFEDVSGEPGCQRDSHWAFDILNVEQAILGPGPDLTVVPEPATLILVGSGVVAALRRKRKTALR